MKRHTQLKHQTYAMQILACKPVNEKHDLFMVRSQQNGRPYITHVRHTQNQWLCKSTRHQCSPKGCPHVEAAISYVAPGSLCSGHIPKEVIFAATWLSNQQLKDILTLQVGFLFDLST